MYREAAVVVQWHIRTGEYHDSITLMQTAQKVTRLPGVRDAAVVMATDANRALLQSAGLWNEELASALPTDVILVVSADSAEAAGNALSQAELFLAARPEAVACDRGTGRPVRSLRGAMRQQPQSNIAVISVAGRYAAREAWQALNQGLHVLLFSDNVSLDDEIALKKYAAAEGLLVMGPGCGTALLNGVALGFANAVRRGPVGVVAAAGTGLQEVTSLLDRIGTGITQGIGTGGRDVSESVGGITMLQGLSALQQDPNTAVIVLISKPPSDLVAKRVLGQAGESAKPTVVCFLGSSSPWQAQTNVIRAATLQEAAWFAAEAAGRSGSAARAELARDAAEQRGQALELRRQLAPGQRWLRGLFSGGTLAAEAQVMWRDLGLKVWSNAALDSRHQLRDTALCQGHCILDLGEEEFTVGRPHPMIDHDLRVRRLAQEAADPEVAVIVLDVVLGYGAHADPAAVLGPAIGRARALASESGRTLQVVTSVTGTENDPQGLERQVQALREAGAVVCGCNAAAARLSGELVLGLKPAEERG